MEAGKEKKSYLIPGAIALSLVGFLILTFLYPPVFALNDDVQLREILSGAYSGEPDLHTVYMRSPLSFLLSTCYRIVPALPWFGFFYCGCCICAFLAVLIVLLKRLGEIRSRSRRALAALVSCCFLMIFFVFPYVRPHYTTLAAGAGGVALFLILSAAEGDKKQGITAAVFLLLCDQIRSQVFYLFCPFLFLAVLYRILSVRGIRAFAADRRLLKKIILQLSGLGAAYLILFATDALAYADVQWREYRELNKARTELYDYTLVWESESAKGYYAGLGVDETAFPLYAGYDLLPDEAADTVRLGMMAAYEEPARSVSFGQHVRNVLYELRVRTLGTDSGDAPYNAAFLCLFAIIFFPCLYRGIRQRRKDLPAASEQLRSAGILLLLPLFHFAIYGWLLWKGRVPERVTVSLYCAGISLCLGVFLRRLTAEKYPEKEKSIAGRVVCGLLLAAFAVISILSLKAELKKTAGLRKEQIAVNMSDNVLYLFAASHPEELFVLDTFATVYRTEEVLGSTSRDAENILLMGGWQYGSPLQEQKLNAYGFDDARALFTRGGAFFVRRADRGITAEELQVFLDGRYGEAAVRLEFFSVITDGDARFEIYRMVLPEEIDTTGC